MKLIKIALVALLLCFNLAIAAPASADAHRPPLNQNPDYLEVTQALDDLLNNNASQNASGEAIARRVGELNLQKYILETTKNGGICRNETGKTLLVYGHKLKQPNLAAKPDLYLLPNGEETDDDWDCDGIYVPSEQQGGGLSTPEGTIQEPVAVKIVDGTQLVAKTNPETDEVEFNVPAARLLTSADNQWFIPNNLQEALNSGLKNAPVD